MSRVLFFSRGLGVHEVRFLRVLAESDLTAQFTPLVEPTEDQWSHLPAGVDVFRLERPDVISFYNVLQKAKPDLIHAGPLLDCGFLAAHTDTCPVIAMSWAFDLLVECRESQENRERARQVLAACDRFLCDSDAVRDVAQQIVPLAEEKIVQFPWGVDLWAFRRLPEMRVRERKRLGWDDHCVFISTRSWDRLRGIHTLLEAFRIARSNDPKLRLILAGGGPEAQRVKQYLADHKLTESVWCSGEVSEHELMPLFAAADVYVSASTCDGSSISLLQAMAMSLPSIAIDIPGNREWIVPGVNGDLSLKEDAASLAERMLHIASPDLTRRERMGAQARVIVEERADWRAHSARLVHLYKTVLNCSAEVEA
jgi:glycosyltransferase involved in cell wall biosynthesis